MVCLSRGTRPFRGRVILQPFFLCCVAGWAAPAFAQSVPADGPAALTGSPSNGTATVSPASVAAAVSRPDDENSFGLSLGTSVASGKFGASSDTHIWSTALGVRYSTGALRLSASLPYMRISSAGTVFSGIDSTPVVVSTISPGVRTTYDGLGDLTLGASYTIPAAQDGLEVEVSGRVKLPTATDASGLSTGRADYSAGVQVTRQAGPFAPFGSLTYRVFGDPHGLSLRDGLAASAGSSLVISENVIALASYHYARAASRVVRDSHELFAGASYLVPDSKLRLTGFATAGLSSGAAAVSGGVSVAVDFR